METPERTEPGEWSRLPEVAATTGFSIDAIRRAVWRGEWWVRRMGKRGDWLIWVDPDGWPHELPGDQEPVPRRRREHKSRGRKMGRPKKRSAR